MCTPCVISLGYQQFKIKFSTSRILKSRSSELLPIDIEAHQILAARFLSSGKPEKAIPHLQRIIPFKKYDFHVRKELGNAYLEAGYYNKALEEYDFLLQGDVPDSLSPDICARKGIALFYLGQIELSKSSLTECLSRFPSSAEAACFLGQIEATLSNQEKSLEYLEMALQKDSTYVEAWYQLARYYTKESNYLKARNLLNHALQIDPLHEKSHSRLGMIYYYLSNPDLARASYQTALALNPDDFNTHYNLGELYYTQLEDTAQALKEYKSAVNLYPEHVEANFKIGLICMNNGMYKEAARYFEQAIANDQNNIRIMLQLAVSFEKLNLKDNALKIYNRILTIDPLNCIAKQKIRLLNEIG